MKDQIQPCPMQVLITGARTATLLQRLPFLPSADAYVAENGGRIFYPDQTLPTAMPLMEDTKWRKSHNPAGARPFIAAAQRGIILENTTRSQCCSRAPV